MWLPTKKLSEMMELLSNFGFSPLPCKPSCCKGVTICTFCGPMLTLQRRPSDTWTNCTMMLGRWSFNNNHVKVRSSPVISRKRSIMSGNKVTECIHPIMFKIDVNCQLLQMALIPLDSNPQSLRGHKFGSNEAQLDRFRYFPCQHRK